MLSPVALLVVMAYSYCKRFTSLAHMVLGLSLGIAPVGAYIAVTGEFALVPCILSLLVMTWCGSFDIIYALQDKEFDRANGLHSIPAKFSVRTSLYISIALHVVTIACLGWFVALLPQSVWIWTGAAIFTAIIIAEHIIVTPTRQRNIPIAFGHLGCGAYTRDAYQATLYRHRLRHAERPCESVVGHLCNHRIINSIDRRYVVDSRLHLGSSSGSI